MDNEVRTLPVLEYLQRQIDGRLRPDDRTYVSYPTAISGLLKIRIVGVDLKATFPRPVWKSTLRATARAVHCGRTISHYVCDITRDDGKPVATISSAVMTLRGEHAQGR